jgi:hypothetical protein
MSRYSQGLGTGGRFFRGRELGAAFPAKPLGIGMIGLALWAFRCHLYTLVRAKKGYQVSLLPSTEGMDCLRGGKSNPRFSAEMMPCVIIALLFPERIGKTTIRPFLSLERLSLDERTGKVGCRYGKDRGGVERMDDLEFIARITSHIPDKGQVTIRYYGLYANAHRGKIRKASLALSPFLIVEEELRPIPSKGWADMIRKVYEVDPLVCPKCGGRMKIISILTDWAVVDKIIDHLKLKFVAERPPPPHLAYQEVLMAAEASTEYFP